MYLEHKAVHPVPPIPVFLSHLPYQSGRRSAVGSAMAQEEASAHFVMGQVHAQSINLFLPMELGAAVDRRFSYAAGTVTDLDMKNACTVEEKADMDNPSFY